MSTKENRPYKSKHHWIQYKYLSDHYSESEFVIHYIGELILNTKSKPSNEIFFPLVVNE